MTLSISIPTNTYTVPYHSDNIIWHCPLAFAQTYTLCLIVRKCEGHWPSIADDAHDDTLSLGPHCPFSHIYMMSPDAGRSTRRFLTLRQSYIVLSSQTNPKGSGPLMFRFFFRVFFFYTSPNIHSTSCLGFVSNISQWSIPRNCVISWPSWPTEACV